jgi:hypothetical protein
VLGISDRTSLGPGNVEGANVGSSLIPALMFISVGVDDGTTLGYKLGTFDGKTVVDVDEGAKVGSSLIPISTLTSIGLMMVNC